MKRLFTPTLLFFTLSFPLLANEDNSFRAPYSINPFQPKEPGMEAAVQAQVALSQKEVLDRAEAALLGSREALQALEEGRVEDARDNLQKALVDLGLIRSSNPGLALAPAEVQTTDYEFNEGEGGDETAQIAQASQKARDLLASGDTQGARRLLESLRSETVVAVENIPLTTFPQALKEARRLAGIGDTQAAQDSLQAALDSLVETDTLVPHPLAEAQEMLEKARQLAEKGAADSRMLGDLLSGAKAKLKLAQAFGYGNSQDYEQLFSQIDSVQGAGGAKAPALAPIQSLLTGLLKESLTP